MPEARRSPKGELAYCPCGNPSSDRCLDWHAPARYITDRLSKYLVMKTSERLDLTFAALADSTRRAILARLASGEATVTELAEPFEMSQPAKSKHLKVLERAGLISVDGDAKRRPR